MNIPPPPFKRYEKGIYNFLDIDSEKRVKKSIKDLGSNWKWNKNFTYNINSWGLRSKELKDIDDNYILFLGCSWTFGFGLPLEDTYAYKISQHYKMDYFNASTPAGGNDLSFYYLKHIFRYKIPKKIVIQWTHPFRKFYIDGSKLELSNVFLNKIAYPSNVTNPKIVSNYINYFENKHYIKDFFNFRKKIFNLCKQNNIDIFEFSAFRSTPEVTLPNYIPLAPTNIQTKYSQNQLSIEDINYYYARDYDLKVHTKMPPHPGIYYQNLILKKYQEYEQNKMGV